MKAVILNQEVLSTISGSRSRHLGERREAKIRARIIADERIKMVVKENKDSDLVAQMQPSNSQSEFRSESR